MKAQIRAAFEVVRDGFSPDRVVADPQLSAEFFAECRRIGLTAAPRDLNRALLNMRKQGELADAQRSRRTTLGDDDAYRFASELAVRFLERRDGISLDDVICDPDLATEFDALASHIAPGYSSLHYRWAALRLRKTRRLRPEILSHAVPSLNVLMLKTEGLDLLDVPTSPGLYIFLEPAQALYVGEATNLRQRIKKHLDHSDRKDLARWIWEFGAADLLLELHELKPDTSTRIRRALETELIRSRRPLFNVQRG